MAETPSGDQSVPQDVPEQRTRARPLELGMSVSQLLETAFTGSTALLIAEAARALERMVLGRSDTLLGLSVDANLMQVGAGVAWLGPLVRYGMIDWIAMSGANVYCDALHALGVPMEPMGSRQLVDLGGGVGAPREHLREADRKLSEILSGPDFQKPMSSALMNYNLGMALRREEKRIGIEYPSLLSTAAEYGVPVYNPSISDNPLGSLIAQLALVGNRLSLDSTSDVNEVAAIMNWCTRENLSSGVWCMGRGAAASFVLEAPRHLRELMLGQKRMRHRVTIRMAGRAHGLPSAPAGEPEDSEEGGLDLGISTDLTVAVPIVSAYLLDRVAPRKPRRLLSRIDEVLDNLRQDHSQAALRSGGLP